MLVDAATSTLVEGGPPSLTLSTIQPSSPLVVGLHGGAVMLSSRNQSRSLFPDEEHSYEPHRRVRFAALSRNALPYFEPTPRRRCPRNSPPKTKTMPPPPLQNSSPHRRPISPAVQSLRKKYGSRKSPNKLDEEYIEDQHAGHPEGAPDDEDPESHKLWGFSVRYSPKKQLEAQWRATQKHNLRALNAKQAENTRQQKKVVQSQNQASTSKADYAQYLHLASLYGPLDTLLYCCCPTGSRGRIYMLLVDISARRLQCWASKRVAALRRYWIGKLARGISESALAEGIQSIAQSFQQQCQATALFQRLPILRATSVLHAWREYTARMVQLREKIHLALAKVIESRFHQWCNRLEARKMFRRQLKYIARRKAMQSVFEQWKVWRAKHENVRCYLIQPRLIMQQECWTSWCGFIRCIRAAKTLQRSWRLYAWRKCRERSSLLIGRVFRGRKTRRKVVDLREKMAIHSVLLRVTSVVCWDVQCEILIEQRTLLLEQNLAQAKAEADYILRVEELAAANVDIELSKVLRNNMHRKLEEQILFLKQEAGTPLGAAKSSSNLQQIGTQKLVGIHRALARRGDLKTFRSTSNRQAASKEIECIICEAHSRLGASDRQQNSNFLLHHMCLNSCYIYIDGTGNALAELRNWENVARAELTKLEQSEQQHSHLLHTTEPSVSSIWQSITSEKARSGSRISEVDIDSRYYF